MSGCCEQREWGSCTFRAIAACRAYRLLNKDCRHTSDVCRGPALCIWPYIPAEGVVQMLGAKEKWQCPSKSAQPAKSSAGGMLCLTAIPVAYAHTSGRRDAPAVKFGLWGVAGRQWASSGTCPAALWWGPHRACAISLFPTVDSLGFPLALFFWCRGYSGRVCAAPGCFEASCRGVCPTSVAGAWYRWVSQEQAQLLWASLPALVPAVWVLLPAGH